MTNQVDVTRHLYATHLAGRIHSRGFVDRVAPHVKHRFTGANHSANQRTAADALGRKEI